MADITIVATAKSATANSFITLADADTYANGMADDTEWDAATTDAKNRALKSATDRLEQETYRGAITDQDQRLSWPRVGTYDRNGLLFDQDTIPRPIEEATVELANAIIKGEYEVSDTGLEGFVNVKIGPLDVTPNHGKIATTLPKTVLRLLEPVRYGASGLSVHISRS